jgi:general secretion pathway protein J
MKKPHLRKRSHKPTTRGFTLLEMLVVLVLVGLLSTLLLQGFFYILHLRAGLLVQLSDLQYGSLQEHWFRSTTAATVADYGDGKSIFRGNEHEFSGLTIAPLEASIGVLAPYAWELQYKEGMTTLRYRKGDGDYWEVATWLGEHGSFRYMDTSGKWYNQWPPQFFSNNIPAQLPAIILLQGQRRQTPTTWIVQLTGNKLTPKDSRAGF